MIKAADLYNRHHNDRTFISTKAMRKMLHESETIQYFYNYCLALENS